VAVEWSVRVARPADGTSSGGVWASCFQVSLNASVHARRGNFERAAALLEESRAIRLEADGTEERFGRDGYY
jgi:hypothetical protein